MLPGSKMPIFFHLRTNGHGFVKRTGYDALRHAAVEAWQLTCLDEEKSSQYTGRNILKPYLSKAVSIIAHLEIFSIIGPEKFSYTEIFPKIS